MFEIFYLFYGNVSITENFPRCSEFLFAFVNYLVKVYKNLYIFNLYVYIKVFLFENIFSFL